MKKIEIEITKDDPIGLKKGDKMRLSPLDAERLVSEKKAKKIQEIEVVSRKNSNTVVTNLIIRVNELEQRIEKLEKTKKQ